MASSFNDSPPPAYETSTVNSTSIDEHVLPSYKSIYGRLRRARKESGSSVEFLKKFLDIVFSPVTVIISLVLMSAVPISMITIGSIYLNDCQAENLVPVWLIVYGSISILSLVTSLSIRIYEIHQKKTNENYKLSKSTNSKCLIDLSLFILLICGTAWIYQVFIKYNSDFSSIPCSQICFVFAFSIITIHWILIALFCICFFCLIPIVCLVICFSNKISTTQEER